MNHAVKQQLQALAEPDYQRFMQKLLPGVENILGVRTPKLRKLAQQLARGDWRTYLATAQDNTLEETMISGMVIGYAKAEIEEILRHIAWFVPKINNWAVCDSFCSTLKITRQYPQTVWSFLQSYLQEEREYFLRFAVVMLLQYYIQEPYIRPVLTSLDAVQPQGYYAQMAVAWAISICFREFPDQTMDYLHHNHLDDFTYHKALQKIIESLKVDPQTKAIIRGMKRK